MSDRVSATGMPVGRYGLDVLRCDAAWHQLTFEGRAAILRYGRTMRDWPAGRPFPQRLLTDKDGFAGVDGIFRFGRNGVAERALEVREVTAAGTKIVSPAATAFTD